LNRNMTIATWSWLMLATILEVTASYYLASAAWEIKDGIIMAVALTAIVPMALNYLDLMGEHTSVKLMAVLGVFFSMDLILIWTAELVH
jgi:hypothetical protein